LFLDTEGSGAPADPLAALEKTTDAQKHLTTVQVPRLEELQNVSEHYGADPYTLSSKVRKRFREEKKVEQQKQKADDELKGKYGLPASLSLLEDDGVAKEEAREEWVRARREHAEGNLKRRKLIGDAPFPTSKTSGSSGSKSSSTPTISALRARILENTSRQSSRSRTSISKSSNLLTKK
jgi:coiled-coil domain-containing protein 130